MEDKEKFELRMGNEFEMDIMARKHIKDACDITGRKETEEELRLQGEITKNLAEGILLISSEGGIIRYTNPAFEKMFGYGPGELTGKHISIVNAPTDDNPEETARKIIETLNKTGKWCGEVKNIRKDGTVFSCYANVTTINHPKYGKAWASIHTDITARKNMERKILSLARFPSENPNPVLRMGNKGKVLYKNPAAIALLQKIGLKKKDIFKILPVGIVSLINKTLREKKGINYLEVNIGDKTYSYMLTPVPEAGYVNVYGRDISEYKTASKKLEALNEELITSNRKLKQLALKDSHTGLYNHRYLGDAIEAEFYRARRYGHPLAVIMLDLDYFKSVNDVYGHKFGDIVLKQFASHLKKTMRKYDTVIRFGGEEFIVISPGIEREKACILAQRILDTVNLHNFGDKKHTVKVKLSVAVASYPEDKILKGMDLITITDQILNKIKEEGGNRVYSSLDTEMRKAPALKKNGERTEVKFLKEKIEKLTRRGNQGLIEAISAFAKTIELKDHYTGEHTERTVHYAVEIARKLNLLHEEIEYIKQAAILHDLGKIGISEKILLKKSKLTRKEFTEIKKHPQIGADILRPIHFMHNIIPLVLYHHERWDGKGYPIGLKGEDIPVGARIITIADVYQALTSNRPYRKAFPRKEALKIIMSGIGTQFDPKIARLFLNILKEEKLRISPTPAAK